MCAYFGQMLEVGFVSLALFNQILVCESMDRDLLDACLMCR